jgi:hypothetical protein
VKYCQSAKNLKIFFLQILVLITLISSFNYKNQENFFLEKCIKHKHMWQHQIHALEVKQNKLPLWSVSGFLLFVFVRDSKQN